MKSIYIENLQPNDIVNDELFRVLHYEVQTGKNGNQYIKLSLGDKSGKIDAKIWGNNMPYCAEAVMGDIVRVSGTVDTFNNTLQLIVTKMQKHTDYVLEDFIQTSSQSAGSLLGEIEKYIAAIENRHIRSFLEKAFLDETFRRNLSVYPAAKSLHHDYVSGLAEHIVDMLHMADTVITSHPIASKDIVYCGIILHDIGKLVEFKEENMTFDYSLEGNMLGHIFIGANWFNRSIPNNFPEELRVRITHIILSHHGKLEYGSPVVPKTYEAVIVNKLDEMSSKLNAVSKAYTGYNGVNDFSEKLLALDNVSLYLRPFAEDTDR